MYKFIKSLFAPAPSINTVLPNPAARTTTALPPELEAAFNEPIAEVPLGFFDRLGKKRAKL